jgi:hypothetical protein
VDASDLLVGLSEVVVRGAAGEVDCDRMLTSGDVKDGRRSREEGRVGGEIGNSESSGHDDEAKRLRKGRVSAESERRRRRKGAYLDALLARLPLRFPQLRNSTQDTDEHVGVDTTLVCLVDDDDTVLGEEEVGGEFAEKNTVGHEDELSVGRGGRGVTDAMSDEGGIGGEAKLSADTCRGREGGDSSRLGDGDHAGVVWEERVSGEGRKEESKG